jgi:hypothetical protein
VQNGFFKKPANLYKNYSVKKITLFKKLFSKKIELKER